MVPISPKYAGAVELTFPGSRVERGQTAFALEEFSPVGVPILQRIVISFSFAAPCPLVRDATYELRDELGEVFVTLPSPVSSCGPLTSTRELAWVLDQDVLREAAPGSLTLRSFYLPRGTIGLPTEVIRYRFWVSDRFAERGTDQPQLRVDLPGVDLPATPNWAAPVDVSSAAAYASESGIVASAPLYPHQAIAWTTTFTSGASFIATPSVASEPRDVGDGIVLEGFEVDGGWRTFSQPTNSIRTWSTRGLIPGERYDVRFVGSAGLRQDGVTLPPSQDQVGRTFSGWVDTGLADAAAAGSRYVFDVQPLRIESPAHRGLVGLSSIDSSDGTTRLGLVFIVPADVGFSGARYEISIRGDDGTFLNSTGGAWPLTSADPNLVSSPVSIDLEQAGDIHAMTQVALRVPLARPFDGPATIAVSIRSPINGPSGADIINATFDMTAPVMPPLCDGTPSNGCLSLVDGDERDCRIDEVCIPESPGGATTMVVRICGEEVTVALRPGNGPAEGGSGRWLCSGPVDLRRPRSPATEPVGVDIELVDAAGNRTASDAVPDEEDDPRTLGRQPLAPPCLTGDRFVPVPYEETTPLHVRTAGGVPVVIASRGSTLVMLRHDGLAWRETPLLDTPGASYRGRIAGVTLDDDTTWFCATHRPQLAAPRDAPAFDIIEDGGQLVLGRIDRNGGVTVTAVTGAGDQRVRAVGCGIAYDAARSQLVVATAGPALAPRPQVAPQMMLCPVEGSTARCGAARDLTSFSGDWPLGFEPDAAVLGGRAHIVGRGVGLAGAASRLREFQLYEVQVPLVGSAAPSYRRVGAETYSLASSDPASGTGLVTAVQYLRPRVVVVRNRAVIVSTRSTTSYVRDRDPESSTGDQTLAGDHEVIADLDGREQVLDRVGNAIGTLNPLFPRARDLAIARYALPLRDDGAARDPERPIGLDVASIRGTLLELAYERRASGLPGDPLTGPRLSPEDGSSLWLRRYNLVGNRLRELEANRTRIDTETGHDASSARYVSLFVDRNRPLSQVAEASVVYDNVRFGSDAAAIFRFADSRAGQFVEDRDSLEEIARTPQAVRTPIVPTGTCWERSTFLTDLSPDEANLVPQYVVGSWASPMLSSTVSSSDALDRHRQVTGAAECAIRDTAEGDRLAGGRGPWNGGEEFDLSQQVRERFVGNYLSLANSLHMPGAAILETLRFPVGRTIPAGTLSVTVENGTGSLVTFTATLPSGAATPEAAVAALNASITPTGAAAPPRFSLVRYRELDGSYRLSVHTTVGRIAAAAAGPPPILGTGIRVNATPLATTLGFPVGVFASPSLVDVHNGDYQDRFAASPRSPCVPQRDVDGDMVGDGTCGRIGDSMEPGRSLLDLALAGVELRAGSPPVRTRQLGMCVPDGPTGALSGDVCAQASAIGEGTNRSYESLLVACSAAGAQRLSNGLCVSCDPEGRLSTDRAVTGLTRRCRTDYDCQPELDCSGPTGCRLDLLGPLCTHLTIPFAGVPAGQGFCAVPQVVCDARISRPITDWHERTAYERCNPTRFPAPTHEVCPSPYAVDPGRDFEPGGLECVAAGCAGCLGRDGFQTYCTADGECPSSHRCVVERSDLVSPACVLRPLLGDGRLLDSMQTSDALVRSEDFSTAGTVAAPIPLQIGATVAELTSSLRTLVPGRSLIVPEQPTCALRSPADPMSDFVETDRGQRVLVTRLEGRLGGARLWMSTDERELPGAGEIVLDIFLDGSAPLRVGARVEARVELAGVRHGIDSDIVVRADAEGLRARLRPYVRYDAQGQPSLGLRLLDATLMRTMTRSSLAATPANLSNLTLESSSQQGGGVSDLFQVLTSLVIFPFLPNIIFENLGAQLALGDNLGELDGVAGLGVFFTSLAFTDALGPLLFGEEIFPFLETTTLEGVAVELAVDASRGATASERSLGLYGRRAPPPAIPLPADLTSTAAFARTLHGVGTDGVCVLGLGQRSPNCLEQQSVDADGDGTPDGNPDTCPQ